MSNNLLELEEILTQVELQLHNSPLDVTTLSVLFVKLDIFVKQLTSAESTEPQAIKQLQRLENLFNESIKRAQQERLVITDILKELNTRRKASHNYDKHR